MVLSSQKLWLLGSYRQHAASACSLPLAGHAGDLLLKRPTGACAQFRKISELEQVAPNEMVDVLGVVDRVEGTNTIQRKDGSEARML